MFPFFLAGKLICILILIAIKNEDGRVNPMGDRLYLFFAFLGV